LKLAVTVILVLSFSLTFADRTIWYVHPDSTLNSIQVALDSCADNDIVLVGPGVYHENIVWANTQGIHLISELGPDTTIIDGDSSGNVIRITTGVDTSTIIRGFTIQNGFYSYAGGIYCSSSSPIITSNSIRDNVAGGGGGIGVNVYSSPIIKNNTITGNIADFGAGIEISFYSSPTILCNRITDNTASAKGGGIYICLHSAPTIDSCTISNNDGDGVYIDHSAAARINYSNITNNTSYGVRKVDPDAIDAEYNWWGDASGPYHPDSNPGGMGDSVSDWVDFIPWLDQPVGVEEKHVVTSVRKQDMIGATILSGPLLLPENKSCRVLDITGRVVVHQHIKPGVYFIEVDGEISRKVVKLR
jgi:parallel beta-helix repeat protein